MKRRGSRRSSADRGDPLDRDYGFGYSEEGRPITDIVDESVHDPQAETFDQKGETSIIDLSKKPKIKACPPDMHHFVEDPDDDGEIPGFVAEKCTNCHMGRMIPKK